VLGEHRFAQAIGQLDTTKTTSCVLTGPTPRDPELGDVVILDPKYASQVAKDASDGVIDGSCAP